jgi:hypothetical protein
MVMGAARVAKAKQQVQHIGWAIRCRSCRRDALCSRLSPSEPEGVDNRGNEPGNLKSFG